MTVDSVAKPDELLALHDVTQELFETLKSWLDVPDRVTISLDGIDGGVAELGDPVMIGAMAMRKLQALRLLAQPGVRTSTDVVVTIVQDLERALVQAPVMRLRHVAEHTDWDAAFAELIDPDEKPSSTSVPTDADADDPEVVRFRELHAALHIAVRAVIEASDGEIRYLE